MKECGLTECELWAPQIEPASAVGRGRPRPNRRSRRAKPCGSGGSRRRSITSARFGRSSTPAGITLYAFNYSPNGSFTDEEIDRGFEMAKALGAEIITASATLEAAQRMVPFADEAPDGRGDAQPLEHRATRTSSPRSESLATALKMSSYFKVNLDIGHFTAANYDAVAYIREHHAEHHQPAHQGSEEEPGRQHAVGHRRHADPRRPAAAEEGALADSRVHRIRAPRRRRAPSTKSRSASPSPQSALA